MAHVGVYGKVKARPSRAEIPFALLEVPPTRVAQAQVVVHRGEVDWVVRESKSVSITVYEMRKVMLCFAQCGVRRAEGSALVVPRTES